MAAGTFGNSIHHFAALTKSDGTNDPLGPFEGIIVDVGGTVKVTLVDGSTAAMTLAAGPFYAQIARVWSTGTAATVVTGFR